MDIRQRAQAANLRARYNCVGSMHSPDEKSAKDSKRGKGRPVGSKDRQPRIKRPATSPLPSERQDKGAGGPSKKLGAKHCGNLKGFTKVANDY